MSRQCAEQTATLSVDICLFECGSFISFCVTETTLLPAMQSPRSRPRIGGYCFVSGVCERGVSGGKSEAPTSRRSAGQDRRPSGTAPPTYIDRYAHNNRTIYVKTVSIGASLTCRNVPFLLRSAGRHNLRLRTALAAFAVGAAVAFPRRRNASNRRGTHETFCSRIRSSRCGHWCCQRWQRVTSNT